ncbi:MAG: MFS transporter [Puniceicoccaceae bacterium]
MTTLVNKLPLGEKVGYSLGDAASNFFFQVSIYYLAFFYTDVFGISPAAMGTMFLIVRIWDTMNDPVMGAIADRTYSRWGKFRPYLLWGSVPFGIAFMAMFASPDLPMGWKLAYAYITYTAMLMAYTVINVPYSALMGVMTPDPQERTNLSTFRFGGAYAAGLIVQYATLNLVTVFSGGVDAMLEKGNEYLPSANAIVSVTAGMSAPGVELIALEKANNDWLKTLKSAGTKDFSQRMFTKTVTVVDALEAAIGNVSGPVQEQLKTTLQSAEGVLADFKSLRKKGYQWTMSLFGLVATVFWLISFKSTRERVQPPAGQKSSLSKDVSCLFKNRPWVIISLVSVFVLVYVVVRGGSMLYFFKYTLAAEYAAPSFLVGVGLTMFLGALSTPFFVKRFGKRSTMLGCIALIALTFGATFFVNNGDWILLWILTIGGAVPSGIVAVIQWAIFADTADYGEWRMNRRITGLVFSSALFAIKTGLTVGGVAIGWYLSLIGFEADAVQSESASHGLRVLHTLFPAALAVIAFMLMWLYPLKESDVDQMAEDLVTRRG